MSVSRSPRCALPGCPGEPVSRRGRGNHRRRARWGQSAPGHRSTPGAAPSAEPRRAGYARNENPLDRRPAPGRARLGASMSIVQRSRGLQLSLLGDSAREFIKPVVMRALLLKERVQSGATYPPLDDGFQQNPYPAYRTLRAKDPVHWSELTHGWVISRFEHVDAILRDHKRFGSDERRAGGRRAALRPALPRGPQPAGHRPARPHAAAGAGVAGVHAARDRGSGAAHHADRRRDAGGPAGE